MSHFPSITPYIPCVTTILNMPQPQKQRNAHSSTFLPLLCGRHKGYPMHYCISSVPSGITPEHDHCTMTPYHRRIVGHSQNERLWVTIVIENCGAILWKETLDPNRSREYLESFGRNPCHLDNHTTRHFEATCRQSVHRHDSCSHR